jgi:hypothetical protein
MEAGFECHDEFYSLSGSRGASDASAHAARIPGSHRLTVAAQPDFVTFVCEDPLATGVFGIFVYRYQYTAGERLCACARPADAGRSEAPRT